MPIVITATALANVAGRTPNHFGLGEVINLTAAVVPPPQSGACRRCFDGR